MAVISQFQVVIPGQTITAALWNGTETNIINNGLIPSGIEDYSSTVTQMQTQADPYPAESESLPTSLQGEIERIRWQLKDITGETYWYIDPDNTIMAMEADINALQTNLVAPVGTKMVFYQVSAPSGWTQDITQNDKALRVVSGAGGGTGGTIAVSTGFSHNHTVNAHSHIIISDGSHSHRLEGFVLVAGPVAFDSVATTTTDTAPGHAHGGSTLNDTPGTDTKLGVIQYVDIIVCTKD
jgi:hypothetical protein